MKCLNNPSSKKRHSRVMETGRFQGHTRVLPKFSRVRRITEAPVEHMAGSIVVENDYGADEGHGHAR